MKKIKKRNPIAYDLLTNNLYKPKVVKSKKKYDRKKNKMIIQKELSSFSLLKFIKEIWDITIYFLKYCTIF